MATRNEPGNVHLPDRLLSRIESRVARTEFDSVDDYVTFVLAETLARVEDDGGEPSRDDEETVRARLEALGYAE